MVNLKYYDVFVRVYERMNMSLVAEELFLSQPAVSRIIRELEEHYSSRFFLRHSGRLYRTAGGERFYGYAKELLACEERLKFAMEDQKVRRKVVLGVSPTIANYYLPSALRSYYEMGGDLDVCLFSGPHRMIEEQLLDSRMDIALVEGQISFWELTAQALLEDELILVSGSAFWEELQKEPFLLLVRNIGGFERHQFEQAFRNAELEYNIRGEFVDVESIKRYAQCGFGVGLVPRGTLCPSDDLKELKIPGLNLTAQFSLIHHRNKFLFPELLELVNHIRKSMGNTNT